MSILGENNAIFMKNIKFIKTNWYNVCIMENKDRNSEKF